MKKAAVQLKYVEAKVKLKQRLEEEDKIEKARQEKVRMKVKEANKEIERFNQAPSAGSGASERFPASSCARLASFGERNR